MKDICTGLPVLQGCEEILTPLSYFSQLAWVISGGYEPLWSRNIQISFVKCVIILYWNVTQLFIPQITTSCTELCTCHYILCFTRSKPNTATINPLFSCLLVAKGKGKGMVKEEFKGPEVCKDPVRLTSYAVGLNTLKQGEDPKLKPAEEYPQW